MRMGKIASLGMNLWLWLGIFCVTLLLAGCGSGGGDGKKGEDPPNSATITGAVFKPAGDIAAAARPLQLQKTLVAFSGATVEVINLDDGSRYPENGAAVVDSVGKFEVAGVPFGQHYLIKAKKGNLVMLKLKFIPAGASKSINAGTIDPASTAATLLAEQYIKDALGGMEINLISGPPVGVDTKEFKAAIVDAEPDKLEEQVRGLADEADNINRSSGSITEELGDKLREGTVEVNIAVVNVYLMVGELLKFGDDSLTDNSTDVISDWKKDGVIGVNTQVKSITITVDLTVDERTIMPVDMDQNLTTVSRPNPILGSRPALIANSNSPTFDFTASKPGAIFQCDLDDSGWVPCTSPRHYPDLPDAAVHKFCVKAADPKGVIESHPLCYEWRVDTTPPDTSITGNPSDPSNTGSASYTFVSTEAGATFECQMDDGGWSSCTSPKNYTGLLDGSHTFAVRATDVAGNTDASPANYMWTVDTIPPSLTLNPVTSPTGLVSQEIGGTVEEGATVNVTTNTAASDGAATVSGTNWSYTITGFVEGTNNVNITAADTAGNTATQTASIVFDATSPTGTISINNNAAYIGSTNVTLALSCTDSSGCSQMQFGNDGVTWSTAEAYAATRTWTLSGNDGTKTVYVRFKDTAGNWSSAYSDTIVLDTTAPVTTALPSGETYTTAQSVTLTCSDGEGSGCDKIYYTTDGSTPTTTSTVYSGQINISTTTTLKFYAVDTAGNAEVVKTEVYTINNIVDTDPPDTMIIDQPPDPSNSDAASFTFEATEAGSTFECQLDYGGWFSCISPKDYLGLLDGTHTFDVRATDIAKNTDPSPASYNWTISKTPHGKEDGWRRKGYDLGGTSNYPFASVPNSGQLNLLWKSTDLLDATVLTADLNNDGNLDIVASNGTTLKAYNGQGTQLWSVQSTAKLSYIGDLDGDNLPEICVVYKDGSNHLKVDVYNGDGTFDKTLDRGASGNDSFMTVLTNFGDYIFVGYGAGYSRTPRGVGILRYSSAKEDAYFATGGGGIWGTFAIGDSDNNGRVEIALPWGTPHNGGSANGTTDFDLYGVVIEADMTAEPATLSAKFIKAISTWNPSTNPNGYDSTMMPDLDGDGISEILFLEGHDSTYYPGSHYVYKVSSTGSLISSWKGSSNGWLPLGTVVNDINSDGIKELAMSARNNEMVYIIDGVSFSTITSSSGAGRVLGASDFNGDGKDEIFVHQSSSGNVLVLDGATLSEIGSWNIGGFTPDVFYNINRFAISDVTGDGKLELIIGANNGLYVIESIGEMPVDAKAPVNTTISNFVNSGTGYTNSTLVTLPISATDNVGVTGYYVSEDSATPTASVSGWATITSTISYSASVAFTLSSGDGTKTVYVWFKDAAGNVSGSANDAIILDTTPPTTTAMPAGGTYTTAQSVPLTCSDGTGSGCDKIYYTTDGSTPTTTSTVYSGQINISTTTTLKFFAVDTAGNAEVVKTEEYTINNIVDTDPPDTSFTGKPSDPSNSGSASFSFTSNESGVTFECQMDGGGWSGCTSPKDYSGLADGSQTFCVKATDGAGNPDQTPACYTWTVDTKGASGPFAYITNWGDDTISVLDTATNAVVITVPVPTGDFEPVDVAVTPDGTHVYIANTGVHIAVMDAADNTISPIVDPRANFFGVAVTPDGSRLYASAFAQVVVIDTKTNAIVATIPVGNNPKEMAVTPDGSRVYVSDALAIVSVIDTGTNTVIDTVDVGRGSQDVAITPDGSRVYVIDYRAETVSVIDTATNTVIATVPVGNNPFSQEFGVRAGLAVAPDGARLYATSITGSSNYLVSVINTATNIVDGTISFNGIGASDVAVTPDGNRLYVINALAHTISIIDTATNAVVDTVAVGNGPSAISIGPTPTVDTLAPSNTTEVNFISGGVTFTTSSSVTLSISATDNVGVISYYASENATPPSPSGWTAITPTASYSASVPFTLSAGDGTKTVYVWFKDAAGNVSDSKSDTITLDTSAPSLTLNPVTSPTGVTSQTISGTVEAGATVNVSTDTAASDGAATVSGTGWSYTITGLVEGTNDVSITATDTAGNTTTQTASIFFDATSPTGTISINNNAVYTSSTTVTLTLSCTDSVGCNQMQFSNDNVSWSTVEAYAAIMDWTLSGSDGTKMVYVKLNDTAGNWSSAYSDTIVLDTTVPATTASPAGGTYTTAQSVTLSCGDGTGSGCDKIYYTTDSATPTTTSAVYSGPINITVTTTLKFFAVDTAGNAEAVKTEVYTITPSDTTPPTNTTSGDFIDGGASSTDSSTVLLSLSATDNVGVTGYYVIDNDSGTLPASPDPDALSWVSVTTTTDYNAAVSYVHTGNYPEGTAVWVYVWFKDAAGNVSGMARDSVTISDSTPPVNTTGGDFINGGATITYSDTVTLTVSATDNLGVTGYCALDNNTGVEPSMPASDASCWKAVSPTTDYSVDVYYTFKGGYSSETTVYVYVWFKDASGNVSGMATDSIIIVPPIFSEDFEGGWGAWYADNGQWEVGVIPTPTPAVGPAGCYNGSQCAGTNLSGNYAEDNWSRLISPAIQLPEITANDEIHLRFQQWVQMGYYDTARVTIQYETAPRTWSTTWDSLATYSNSSGKWAYPILDLSKYAGKKIRIGFSLEQARDYYGTGGVNPGWYIDDVVIIVKENVTTVIPYLYDFEPGWDSWYADNGQWEVGGIPTPTPTVGPGGCPNGSQCAATNLSGNYAENNQSRLISPQIQLPAITSNDEIHLRFQHWVQMGYYDTARVTIQYETAPRTWSAWESLATYSNSSGKWAYPILDLSKYAGKKIRIGFSLEQARDYYGTGGVNPGWYIDDVVIIVKENITIVLPPADSSYLYDFEPGWDSWYADNGQWEVGTPTSGPGGCYNGSQCAATNLSGNYAEDNWSRLISPHIQLPAITVNDEIHLRFQQWVQMGYYDTARVTIQYETAPRTWSAWESLATYSNSSGKWAYPILDLSKYAGKKIRIGLSLEQARDYYGTGGVNPGWYIDDVLIEAVKIY